MLNITYVRKKKKIEQKCNGLMLGETFIESIKLQHQLVPFPPDFEQKFFLRFIYVSVCRMRKPREPCGVGTPWFINNGKIQSIRVPVCQE